MAAGVRALADELGAPLGAVLEGGYDLTALATRWSATMADAGDGATPREWRADPLPSEAAEQVGRYWEVSYAWASRGGTFVDYVSMLTHN